MAKTLSLSDLSVVYWCSDTELHKCGYCQNEQGSISHGMSAKTLTVDDYQNLIDRGWRRSGSYCYKPLMKQICCPLYTIKCEALNFSLSKSQKKVIKKFNKFLNDGELKPQSHYEIQGNSTGVEEMFYRHRPPPEFDDNVTISTTSVRVINTPISPRTESQSNPPTSESSNTQIKIRPEPKGGVGVDPTKPPCKKAKALRLEKKQAKLLKRGMSLEDVSETTNKKTLESFLGEIPEGAKHKLKLQLVNMSRRGEEWERVRNVEFELYKKYQMTIHNDPPRKLTMEGFSRFLIYSPLKITLEQIDPDHEIFETVATLYAKYQIAVHNDSPSDCDSEQFLDFLVETPLKSTNPDFGSFHQLYWLDDKLIAVGVVDILPKCVSAVYFFYDPDYRSLTLGTYGALREVQFARSLHSKYPSLQYYYMGFYIHSCPKMRYKGKLSPSFLLCPETYKWVAIEKCLAKLEAVKYSRLVDDPEEIDEDCCASQDVDDIKILYNRALIYFKRYKRMFGEQDVFDTIGHTIGKKCARTLVFISNN